MKVTLIAEDPAVVRALNETLERCRILMMERHKLVRTRERMRWVAAALNPLYRTPPPKDDEPDALTAPRPPVEEMSALAALCLIGWCWRAAECGDPERLRPGIEAAYDAAKLDTSVPSSIAPAWAAWKFLEDGGRPGLASPGATDQHRLEWFDAAFAKMHETYGAPAGIRLENSRAAFEHGVVIHDVERVALGLGRLI